METSSFLDPRAGGKWANLISKKCYSYAVAYVDMVTSVIGFFLLVCYPSSVKSVVQANTTSMVLAGFLTVMSVAFSVILLFGLHKNRRLYIKTYCYYAVGNLALIVLEFTIKLCVHLKNIGFLDFLSVFFSLFLNLVFFFVVRSYYLITYCNGSSQLAANQPKGRDVCT